MSDLQKSDMRIVGGPGGMPPEPRAGKWGTIRLRITNLPQFLCLLSFMRLICPYFLESPKFWGYPKADITSMFATSKTVTFFFYFWHWSDQFDIRVIEKPIKMHNSASGTQGNYFYSDFVYQVHVIHKVKNLLPTRFDKDGVKVSNGIKVDELTVSLCQNKMFTFSVLFKGHNVLFVC